MPEARHNRSDDAQAKDDIYLKLDLMRSGAVRGESEDTTHKDEILIIGWDWGIHASSAMGAAGPASKATIKELRVFKHVDRSSPVFMSAVRNNDAVKKGVLTMRKPGGDQKEYLTVTIEKGRVTSYDIATGGSRGEETITFSFKKVTVEYKRQRADGQTDGSVMFQDEIE